MIRDVYDDLNNTWEKEKNILRIEEKKHSKKLQYEIIKKILL